MFKNLVISLILTAGCFAQAHTDVAPSMKSSAKSSSTKMIVTSFGIGTSTFSGYESSSGLKDLGRTGFRGSVLVEFKNSGIEFQTGLSFQQEGTRLSQFEQIDGILNADNADILVNFIGVPLVGKVYLQNIGWARSYLRAGVTPVYVVSANASYTENSGGSSSVVDGFDDKINKFNALGSLAAGIRIPMSNTDIRLEAFYGQSFLPYGKVEGLNSRSSSMGLELGMGFDI